MNSDDFTSASIALLRSAVGWQSAIARRLGVGDRTVRRWLAAGETPAWAGEKLIALMGGTAPGPFPRDEWAIGDGASDAIGDALRPDRRREYIVHLAPPRFAARIVSVDDDGRPTADEIPADVVSGIVYASDEMVLCEIAWFDRPDPGQVTQLMEAACDAIDRLTDDVFAGDGGGAK